MELMLMEKWREVFRVEIQAVQSCKPNRSRINLQLICRPSRCIKLLDLISKTNTVFPLVSRHHKPDVV